MSCKIILLKKNNKIHIYKILLIIFDINNLRNDLNNKNRRVSSLQNDLHNSEQRNRNLERCINDKRYENDNLNSRLNDMTREVRSLESRLDNKCQENSKIRSRLDWYLFKEPNEKEEEKKRDVYVCPNSQMSYSMKNEAIATVKKYFDLYDSNCWRVEHIRKHFDDKYGKCWHCII